jgi:peptidoglycan/xylan/chitin deacetylase (PgdA/CDA1 family)
VVRAARAGTRPSSRLRRALFAAAGVLGFVAFVLVWQPLWAYDLLARAFPRFLWRVETRQPLVALSFDDGPAPDHTPRVLEILARYDANATFFLIGNRVVAHPATVELIRAGGHEVANHHYTLRSTLRMTDAEFVDGLRDTESALKLEGTRKLFRPPGGRIRSRQLEEAQRLGYTCVLGSAYPFDGAHPPTAYIRWVVSKNLAPGTVVILHDGIADPSRSIAALPGILDAGRRKGLRFVSVGTLLGSR